MQGLDYREGEELSWCLFWSNILWQEWSCGLVHCPGGNATNPIWRVLASCDGISALTNSLKTSTYLVFLFDCLSSGNRVHVNHTNAVKKRDHQKFVGGFALSGLFGSGRATMLTLNSLWIIVVDPAFIAGHQRIKNCGIWIDQLYHQPAVMTTSFFLIFSEHPWDKLRANLLQILTNNCVYSSHTDMKLCAYCLYWHTTVLIHEIIYLANQLWCSDSLLLPHLSSPLADSLPSLNLLCHSKTDARFMQDAPKAVWSIQYVSVAFSLSLKQNFIAYRSSKVSSRPDCIFEIHQLWQSDFSRVYSNCCCSCSFESEIIKIGQSSHKIYVV